MTLEWGRVHTDVYVAWYISQQRTWHLPGVPQLHGCDQPEPYQRFLDKSYDKYKDQFPKMTPQLNYESYVDVLGQIVKTLKELEESIAETDVILKYAGIKVHK